MWDKDISAKSLHISVSSDINIIICIYYMLKYKVVTWIASVNLLEITKQKLQFA